MKKRIKLLSALFLATIAFVLVLGPVQADYGDIHSNFSVSISFPSRSANTTVKSAGSAYRPQTKCELLTAAGASVSTNANWGSYGAPFAPIACPGAGTLLMSTHTQWVNATPYYWYAWRP